MAEEFGEENEIVYSSSDEYDDGAPLLPVGARVAGGWRVDGQLGRGAFGQVFSVSRRFVDGRGDGSARQTAALKAALKWRGRRDLTAEAVALRLMHESEHVVRLLDGGKLGRVRFVLLELIGPDLDVLRRRQPNECFSADAVNSIGWQALAGLRDIHAAGFVHRDLKPQNVAFGLGKQSRTLKIFDFGTVLNLNCPSPSATAEPFVGSRPYASVSAHRFHPPSTCDDLWSVYYSLVELSTGQLPWRTIFGHENLVAIKSNYSPLELTPGDANTAVRALGWWLEEAQAEAQIDYGELQKLFAFQIDDPWKVEYDWQCE